MMINTADEKLLSCAACGKGGDGLKTCTACKMVKYCNATCQKAHRPKHKKVCRKRAAELHDEALFKQPPPNEECPICCLLLPLDGAGQKYQPCCGKTLCCGCIYAVLAGDDRILCPFCRTPEAASDGEAIERLKKRVEGNDAHAIHSLGSLYYDGSDCLPQNRNKAIQLWLRAGELGCSESYNNAGNAHYHGEGVERDIKKARYYCELAAMGGCVYARYNLGIEEGNARNMSRALKHFMISVGAGCDDSLKAIRQCFLDGHATKDDFEKALRTHKEAADEMKSDQREAFESALRDRKIVLNA